MATPNNGMHPTRDTHLVINLHRLGRAGDARVRHASRNRRAETYVAQPEEARRTLNGETLRAV